MRPAFLVRALVLAAAVLALPVTPALAAPRLTPETVNGAAFAEPKEGETSPVLLRAQVLLDRARFSPGVIDGRFGSNMERAVKAFARAQGLPETPRLTPELYDRLVQGAPEPALVPYKITPEDVKGPFARKIPAKMEDMADLDRLAYREPEEGLAEKFHTSIELLKSLNPGRSLDEAGSVIQVPNVASAPDEAMKGRVTRVEVDKPRLELRAFDEAGALVASYPASIGSEEKPAPSGTHRIEAVALNPTYTYNPDYAFKGVKAKEKFTIKPGPNNPVGSVWIDLSLESYGIHGTPEPDRVGKAYSHGCVRLTNWDARSLAHMVKRGSPVDFLE